MTTKKSDSEDEVLEVKTDVKAKPVQQPPFECAGKLCGHTITAYPCPFCGYSA